ncbi:hypothetical protein HHO41_18265 [Bacillus sp. DNRA2]|uniref:hypothetical protein n=1 Tax=Bacillus sp. DNRA2 TaxID=2723053 RepID=UPI00145D4A31|nr:hypothetical protein [Bacillus sp. DNRA2]NMD72219.1 hypothetical protein [Bacillus sp. DNRA2]
MDSIFFSYPSCNIFINDRNLVSIIKDRAPNFRPELFDTLPPDVMFLPSRHLLDKPDGNCSEDGKVAIYICTCGYLECHGIQIDIFLEYDRVIWKGFVDYRSGEHTPIDDGLTFVFDRKQYEAALEPALHYSKKKHS